MPLSIYFIIRELYHVAEFIFLKLVSIPSCVTRSQWCPGILCHRCFNVKVNIQPFWFPKVVDFADKMRIRNFWFLTVRICCFTLRFVRITKYTGDLKLEGQESHSFRPPSTIKRNLREEVHLLKPLGFLLLFWNLSPQKAVFILLAWSRWDSNAHS